VDQSVRLPTGRRQFVRKGHSGQATASRMAGWLASAVTRLKDRGFTQPPGVSACAIWLADPGRLNK